MMVVRLPWDARFTVWLTLLAIGLCQTSDVQSDEPLHVRIDGFISRAAGGPPAARAEDAEFVRRVYLDLAGRIPSAEQARRFVTDAAPDKRAQLIDQLLDGDDYPRRMQELFHVVLMERLGEHEDWSRFLHDAFAANKPWNQIVREILDPDHEEEATRGAALFLTKRLENYGQNPVDLPALTRDVGRLFLGIDVQCAQCHDHPLIDDYKQEHFQGLLAFVGHTFIRRDKPFPAVGENLVKDKVEFQSVFILEKMQTGPRLPGGEEVAIATFEPGEEYVEPPDRKTRFPGVPKFRPLAYLAEQLPQSDNEAFVRNSANRFWFLMMGRGLVHPLDLHHRENPPSHPELLDLLSREFAAHDFDVKWLLRELALSQTYQRSSRLPPGVEKAPEAEFGVAIEKPLSAEQLMWSMLQATGERQRLEAAGDSAQGELDRIGKKFLSAYANPPRQPEVEFMPSLRAALFLLNDRTVLDWLTPRAGNLVERLAQEADCAKVADELYWHVLTRSPSDEESAEAVAYLEKRADRRAEAIGQLAWALLASTEFCVNH